ncbi:MAG: glycosidase, partial [Acidobacteria bacterium]|nr:glycosidase [Acidobacteriota bacterium]
THAVGPMRTYCLSAMLLDRDDPLRVIGSLDRPLMSPEPDETYGYVPNVVYSCGSLLHRGSLVIPYGIADHSIGIATVAIDDLLGVLTA